MKFLLASDMDGTVIPLETTSERRRAIAEFKELVQDHDGLTLAYVTGRDLALALAGIVQWALPQPDVIVGDVGTSIHWSKPGGFELDSDYAELMKEQMGGFTGADVMVQLESMAELELQPSECQSDFKTSYFVPLTRGKDDLLETVTCRLEGKGLTVNVIYSIDPHKRVGLVDVLPAGVAKDFAVRHLAQRCGLDDMHVVYAGDSGNDLKAFVSGYPAIAVANTPDWVKDEIRANPKAKIYLAKAPSTAGVIEGCRHWGLFPDVNDEPK